MARRRGLVVLPAIAGVNDYIRGVCGRLADAGWSTECVDYFGAAGVPDLSSPPKILAAVEQVDDESVLQRTRLAVAALQERGAEAVGVIGFCIGGTYAMLSACSVDGIAAVANYYGGIRYARRAANKPASPLDRAGALRVPMVAHYGSVDRFVPPADVDALEAALDESGRTFELFRYAGAPHAFDEEQRPAYRPVAAREAWARTLSFLDWYVR